MDFVRLRRRFAGAAVIAAIGLTPALLAPTAASAQSCSDVTVVFARGTGEPAGIGRVGQAFVDALRPQLGGRTLSAYGVAYPATYDFAMAADGAADAAAFVTSTAQSCPDSRIVLGGFSQGAAVVDMLAGIPPLGNRIGALGPVLPPNVAPTVAAVAVFGNPATKFGNPITSAPIFGGRAIDLCTDGDPICSRGRNPFAHSDYVGAGMANRAADFVARLV
ncbi:cutinase [Mycobacterium sp. 852002-51152_SCH6134967]|uniref:cutinase family protein n=1 Tax=Mycobacterium sp. 852002-51152_SCH6134967 TaxID=1834096 RepID=UPI0007FB8B25|nr:cutinase [Mycobacterium sp. 852002-51152_SCH6134967]